MESLVCPKCRGGMRTYERSGITVDQCGDCRGIFLDRGELERLMDAEARFNTPQQPRYEEKKRYDDDRRYDDRQYGNQHQHKRKKKSFLEDLFD